MKFKELINLTESRSVADLGIDYQEMKNRSTFGNANFYVAQCRLTSLHGSPTRIVGTFLCWDNKLENLKGGPKDVDGNYICHANQITSLEGAPAVINGAFNCGSNRLSSFEFAPKIIKYGASFSNNRFSSLHDIHKHIESIGSWHGGNINGEDFGLLKLTGNPIKSHVLGLLKIKNLKKVELDNKEVEAIINKYLPEGDILDCQEELIDAGFEEYAQL